MKLSCIALVLVVALAANAYPPFADWSAPTNVGPPVNTTIAELAPFISKNGLTLYFGRGGSASAIDIGVSQRTFSMAAVLTLDLVFYGPSEGHPGGPLSRTPAVTTRGGASA